jgi:hypothetical protein
LLIGLLLNHRSKLDGATPMKKYTVTAVLSSEKFVRIAVDEAIEEIAKVNGRTFEETKAAYLAGVKKVQDTVADMLLLAAEKLTEELNNRPA